jgi:uncharacterized protein YjbJ (UPF0337 family)
MGEDPSTIREDIDQTRERMGDTVEALAYKTDVKSRAKDSVTRKTDAVKDKLTGAAGSVGETPPSGDDIKQSTRKAAGVAQENPLGLAIAALGVGFLAGMLVPSTDIENEKIGAVADQVKGQAKEAAGTAIDHGKDAAQAAVEAAKETGQEHAEEAKSDLQHQAHQAKEQISSS